MAPECGAPGDTRSSNSCVPRRKANGQKNQLPDLLALEHLQVQLHPVDFLAHACVNSSGWATSCPRPRIAMHIQKHILTLDLALPVRRVKRLLRLLFCEVSIHHGGKVNVLPVVVKTDRGYYADETQYRVDSGNVTFTDTPKHTELNLLLQQQDLALRLSVHTT